MTATTIQTQVGRNLQRVRIAKRLTQEEVANQIGMYSNHLGRIERGEENITLQTISKLSAALHVPPARFFRGVRVQSFVPVPAMLMTADLIGPRKKKKH